MSVSGERRQESGPARRELLIATLFLLGLMGIGTVGYSMIEQWSLSDGLYMTFITMTTIGFQEVNELSSFGRILTIFIGLAGIGTVAFMATRSAQILVMGQRLKQRQLMQTISKLSDHYILCGYGRIGMRIAENLRRSGVPFVIIENAENKVDRLKTSHLLYIDGDAEEEESLEAAGITKARGLILTLPEDSVNVFVTLVAREINPDLFILVRTDKHENRRKLIRAGADKVVSPYEIGADRMAQVILRPAVDRFMEKVLHTEALNLMMEEVTVRHGASLAGKSLAESNLRQHFDAIVVSIMDGNSLEMKFNPDATDRINAGDTLIILGSQEMIQNLRKDGCGS
ncbi:MAG: potassium channel protein [Rhodothermia bacterium]|nr:MAG: potassium channel protein [Rhodothermia bacterium]